MEDSILVNRVAESSLITINLENYYPQNEFKSFDLKDYLFHGLILKEKDFRDALKSLDWTLYQDKSVLITCSTDAVIPLWAYMLVESYLVGIAKDTFQGTEEDYLRMHYRIVLSDLDLKKYTDQRIVIKGCSNKPVPSYAYGYITRLLKPYAQSIMFGEPCSTVPIYKRPRKVD